MMRMLMGARSRSFDIVPIFLIALVWIYFKIPFSWLFIAIPCGVVFKIWWLYRKALSEGVFDE